MGRGQGSRCEVESGDQGRSGGQKGVEMGRGQGSRCEVERGGDGEGAGIKM